MVNINFSLKLPKEWEDQTNAFKDLVSKANKNMKHSITESVDIIFELVYGTLEYLESDAKELAKTERIINNHRIKSYEDQLVSLINSLELISQEQPELAPDRYQLYLEIFRKLLYINLDAISFFIRFLHHTQLKINVKKVSTGYLVDFVIFATEIAILASQDSRKKTQMNEIYQEISKLLMSSHFNTVEFIYPFVAYGIANERTGNFNEAANAYSEALTRISALINSDRREEIPLQLIHETIFFGYISSFIGNSFDSLGNTFFNFVNLLDENVANIIRAVHSILFFGYNVEGAFSHIVANNELSVYETVDFYLKSSSVQSKQLNNTLWLDHIEAKNYLKVIENKARKKGAQEGILIVESRNLKGIQVYIDKNKLLPSLNVYPGQYSNYVVIDEVRFNVKHQFAFGQSFEDEIEIHVNFEKKTVIKKKFNIKDEFPPFFLLDLTDELKEFEVIKHGGLKKFDMIWSDNMSLLGIIKNIINLDNAYFDHKNNENVLKEFFKELITIFKKIHVRECEQILQEMQKQKSTYTLVGPALKVVILQRIASLDPTNSEIEALIKSSIS